MSVAINQALYRKQFHAYGEVITLKRGATEISVHAKVSEYTPAELVGGIVQGDRRIMVLAEDVSFDPPLKRGDKALVRGHLLNIESVDDNTRREAGTLLAYVLQARG
jgi:hypothetical protein